LVAAFARVPDPRRAASIVYTLPAILALAVVFGVLSLPVGPFSLGPLNFLNLAAVVAAGVYLADVRPALRRIAGGGSSGPYGRW